MMLRCLLLALVLSALVGPAGAQVSTIPPGAYRTAADFRHRQPQVAGTNAVYPDKRGLVVVTVPSGGRSQKVRLAPDSLWGYVTAKGRTRRLYRGTEYQLESADTLAIYTSSDVQAGTGQTGSNLLTPSASTAMGLYTTPHYYFSVGLNGLIFPLTPRFLREQYQASNPAFVQAVADLSFGKSLVDFNAKTGRYRVSDLYRQHTP